MRGLGAVLAACVAFAASEVRAQASEHGALELLGFQFRLFWPATGDLSPDVFAMQRADPRAGTFCWEWSFPGGEDWRDLGQPFEGVLLVGVSLAEDAAVRYDAATLNVHYDGGIPDPLYRGPLAVRVHAGAGQVQWFPVAIVGEDAAVERLFVRLNGVEMRPDDVRTSCAE